MVGVPRSRGCRNCRRKKKGCDLQKPTCGQCARLNIACGWDEKQWTFVSQEPGPEGSSMIPIRSRSVDTRRAKSVSPPTSSPARSLNRTAAEVDSDGAFWTVYLPPDVYSEAGVGGIYSAPWFKVIQDMARLDKTVRTALSACALTTLGRTSSDKALLQEGTRLYASALSQTNRALQDPTKVQSDAVLASCKVLAMYENLRLESESPISSQGHDWLRHVEGTCKIVELRGPSKHVSYHGHTLFEDARMNGVIAGMSLRKPNFFSTLAWHTIPWETSPRNLRDELVDIMVALPDIFQTQDKIAAQMSCLASNRDRFAILTAGQSFLNRCIAVGEALRQWELKALTASAEKSTPQNYAGPLTILDVCKDHGYGFFHTTMQYWTTCLLLCTTTWITYHGVMNATKTEQPLSLPSWMNLPAIPDWMNPRPVASNIAKCSPHYFTDEARVYGAQMAAFPMGAALHYYAATGGMESPEMQLMRTMLNDRGRAGVTNMFLRSIANIGDRFKGDPRQRDQHVRMASSWFGIDTAQQRQTSESSSHDDQD